MLLQQGGGNCTFFGSLGSAVSPGDATECWGACSVSMAGWLWTLPAPQRTRNLLFVK